MHAAVQVIERAKDRWAEDPQWSTLAPRMKLVAGDFFDAGEHVTCCDAPFKDLHLQIAPPPVGMHLHGLIRSFGAVCKSSLCMLFRLM